jgi:hypothetical protein
LFSLGLVRLLIIAAITTVGFAACVNPELKHSKNANLVRAAARDWLAHHPAFVARNGDYVSGVAVWSDHAEVPIRSAFAGDVHAILRLERIDSSWKVISAEHAPAKQSKRPNQALERTADRRDNLLSMTSTLKPGAQLALVSGRSSCSR